MYIASYANDVLKSVGGGGKVNCFQKCGGYAPRLTILYDLTMIIIKGKYKASRKRSAKQGHWNRESSI